MLDKVFQDAIVRAFDAVHITMGIANKNGEIIACSQLDRIGKQWENFSFDKITEDIIFEENGCTCVGFGDAGNKGNQYLLFLQQTDTEAKTQAKLIAMLMSEIKKHDAEKNDKSNFIKGVILDNILPGDIFLKVKELNFNSDVKRLCMVLKIENQSGILAFDYICSLFPDRDKDFVISLNENDIAIVKEIAQGVSIEDVEKVANYITSTLSTKYYLHGYVGIGSMVDNVRDLAASFKEAQVALEIVRVFEPERSVINYGKLGIARLIYQLPTTICEMFMQEVFQKDGIDTIDVETLFTIQKFFENNLNVSETARKLFIHRNTLVYRLEKFHKSTGLDLRRFDDAILFKVATMVKEYLSSNPIKF